MNHGFTRKDLPSPLVPRRTMPTPAWARRTTCLARASWSIDSSALKGVVSGTDTPFAHARAGEVPLVAAMLDTEGRGG